MIRRHSVHLPKGWTRWIRIPVLSVDHTTTVELSYGGRRGRHRAIRSGTLRTVAGSVHTSQAHDWIGPKYK